jgi:hypothetical protein
MDVTKILEDLCREHKQLEEAIFSLERLFAGDKRRGHPPAWLAAAKQSSPSVTGGPGRPAGSRNRGG